MSKKQLLNLPETMDQVPPRSLPPEKPPRGRHPKAPKNNFFARPEARSVQSDGGKKGGSKSSRVGVPNGWSREELIEVRSKAEKTAKRKVKIMADEHNIEDSASKRALEYAVSVIEANVDATRDRLAAARLILDFTKQKPASKNEHTINKAEDFLAALAKEPDAE